MYINNILKKDSKVVLTTTSGTITTKNQNFETGNPTGSTEFTNSNNIYDLVGNVYDWTLELTIL